MKFGHFCLPTYIPDSDGPVGAFLRRWLDLLVRSEELGFDSIWANEHHFDPYGGVVPSTPILLSAVAQRTQRVRLGTSVVVLPLHNPVQIAEQLAMVDVLSGGRLEFGLGRGFVVADYEALGIPRDNAQERLLEGLEVILKAWSSRGPFTHRGTHYHYEDVDVWPRPEQQPHPPVWLSCTQSPDSFAYAGRRGFRLLTIAYVAHTQLAELIGRYQEAWQEAGYPAAGWEISTHYHTVVAEDGAEARRLAETALRRYLAITAHARQRARAAEPPRNFTDEELQIDRLLSANRTLAGRPDDVVAQLEQARDRWGLTGVDCTFYFGGLSYEQAQRSQHLFATEVMPRVRERERGVDAWRLLSSQTPV